VAAGAQSVLAARGNGDRGGIGKAEVAETPLEISATRAFVLARPGSLWVFVPDRPTLLPPTKDALAITPPSPRKPPHTYFWLTGCDL
jgi:hypothetical protein